MMGKTHLLIGGAAWLGIAAIPGSGLIHNSLAIGAGWFLASFGALCPDMDQKQSMGSKMFGPITGAVSWLVRKVSGGHRKLTHSLLGFAIVAAIFGACVVGLHLIPWIAAAFLVGWVSHVLADMLTVQGCPLMYPSSRRSYGLHLMKTNHVGEHWFILPVAILANVVFIGMVVT
jgi:membrane-bound metal-dependent hydrolase YbcI (DUF457 family)